MQQNRLPILCLLIICSFFSILVGVKVYENLKFLIFPVIHSVGSFDSISYQQTSYEITYTYVQDGVFYKNTSSKVLFVWGGDVKKEYPIVILKSNNSKSTITSHILPNCIAWFFVFILPFVCLILLLREFIRLK